MFRVRDPICKFMDLGIGTGLFYVAIHLDFNIAPPNFAISHFCNAVLKSHKSDCTISKLCQPGRVIKKLFCNF